MHLADSTSGVYRITRWGLPNSHDNGLASRDPRREKDPLLSEPGNVENDRCDV